LTEIFPLVIVVFKITNKREISLKMPKVIIYCAENCLNKKVYIGQTSRLLARRIKGHLDRAIHRPKNSFYSDLLKNPECFSWRILSECQSRAEANKLEAEFINKFEGRVYNLRKTYVPDNLGELVSRGRKGIRCSEDTKMKISLGKRGKKPNRIYTKPTEDQIAKYRSTKIKNAKYKILDLQTGEIFNLQQEICAKYNISKTYLSKHLLGGRPHCKGLKFRRVSI
jgi:hypothetical protein